MDKSNVLNGGKQSQINNIGDINHLKKNASSSMDDDEPDDD